jgi:hypothetical protein
VITRDRNVVTVEGGVTGDVIAMSLEETAFDHVMEQLTRLYSDPILAFIREVSTNADDARIEARSGRPTEVTLPSKLNPLFTVRDFGTGMDYDTFVYIYSRYGASTKRHSNDFNGALGFGCKAPLAYTPQFTIVSVKDGLRNVVSCARKPSGGGNMTVAEKNVPTDEPNGTTVMVPVKSEDVDNVRERAARFYRYWKPGTVKVNGDEPERLPTHMRLSPRFAVVKGEQDTIIMANVAYPVSHRLDHGLLSGYSLVAEVPTGEVDFVGSREALEYTAHTRATLAKVVQDFKEACKGAVQKQIDAAQDRTEALQRMIYWSRTLPGAARSYVSAKGQPTIEQYTYKGAILPAEWTERRTPGQEWPFLVSDIKSYVASRHETSETIDASSFPRDVFVLGFTPGKFVSSHKERLNLWRADNTDATTDAKSYICCRATELPDDLKPWIDSARVVKWEDVKSNYKLPVNRDSSGASYGGWKVVKGSYEDVWTESGSVLKETPASDIRQDKPLYYFQTRDYNLWQGVEALKLLHPQYTVVKLQANRIGKFCRDFPKAKPLRDALVKARDKWVKTVTADQLEARKFQHAARYGTKMSLLSRLDASKIKDPAIAKAIRIAKVDLTSVRGYESIFQSTLGSGGLPRLNYDERVTDVFASYPLVTAHADRDAKTLAHTYLYINMVYTATNS